MGTHHRKSRDQHSIKYAASDKPLHRSWAGVALAQQWNTLTMHNLTSILIPYPMSMSSPKKSSTSSPRVRPVPAVTRAVAILRLLGRSAEPMNVKSIADTLDLVPSTCLHILRALTAEQLLHFDPASKRYRLGSGMLALARGVLQTDLFAQHVQQPLDLLAQKWGGTALGVETLNPQHMVVTALSHSKLPFRLHVDVGSRFPSLISATGRLVAAHSMLSPTELKHQFEALRWQQRPDFEDWWLEVQHAKHLGYSLDQGNYITGITLAAAPVLDAHRQMTHSIVLASISDQLGDAKIPELVQDLSDCAKSISTTLFSLE